MIVLDIINYIDSKTASFAPILVDVLDENESIAIRQLPSNNNVVTYMDGSRNGNFEFSMFAKSVDKVLAINQLNEYEEILNFPSWFQLTDECKVKVAPRGSVSFSSNADNNTTLYVNDFTLEYIIERK